MPPVPPDRLRSILEKALRLDEPARTAFVEAMWDGDVTLQCALQELLEGSGPVAGFLSDSPASLFDALPETTQPHSPQSTGRVFPGNSQFELIREIAAGGSSQVFEAFDRTLGIRVALKVLLDVDPDAVDLLKRGWRTVGTLAHQNLCRIYQFIYDEPSGAWLLSMELIEGEPFDLYLRGHQDRIRESFCQLADAISALHHASVCHGDVKPSNVLVTPEGRVMVLDFGLSHWLGPVGGPENGVIGFTPRYAAPELFAGERASAASDWYAVGVMLQVVADAAGAAFPSALLALSERLTARNPADRPGDAEVVRALSVSDVYISAALQDQEFVGRDDELGRVRLVFESRVLAGQLAVMHISGVSGIGKSAFAERALRSLKEAWPSARSIAGRCYEGESVPFKTLDEVASAVASLLASFNPEVARGLMPPDAHRLGGIFPVFRALLGRLGLMDHPAAEPVEMHEARRQAFDAFARLMLNLARHQPLVIFIDDVQWGDLDSARLLRELIGSGPPLLLLLAYRGAQGPLNDGLELLRAVDFTPLELGPLTPGETRDLAVELLGDRICPDDAGKIATEAGGSPFFVRQLVQHRIAGGEPALGKVIQERLTSLSSLEQRSLEVLAIARAPLSLAELRDAAGVGEQIRFVQSALDSNRLICSLGTLDEVVVLYHDRIAEAISGRIESGRGKEIHLRIALALEASRNSDLERVALHFYRADAIRDACRLGCQAAERSSTALAFERSAALYRSVLEWSDEDGGVFSPAEVASIQRARGEALVNCGRGVDAARAFQQAIPISSSADAAMLRVRASSELLRAGEVREGMSGIRDMLKQYGFPVPASRGSALALYLLEQVRLKSQMLLSRLLSAGRAPLTARERTRMELCWAAATGTSMVFPLLAEIYFAMYLRLALRRGEPGQLAQGLATHASRLAYVDDGKVPQARKLIARAQEFVQPDASPYVVAMVSAMAATIEGLRGNWRRCLEEATRSESIFRTQCLGAAWEIATISTYLFSSRTMLGEWNENEARINEFLQWTKDRGDLYAEVTINLVSASYARYLAADQPDLGEATILRYLNLWPQEEDFDVQRLYAFQSLVNLDLYRSNPRSAWKRIEETWPLVEKSGLLRLTLLQTFIEDARGRAALALAPYVEGVERARLITAAQRASRLLLKSRARYAGGLGHLLAAGIASLERRGAETAAHLRRAEQSFQHNELIPWLAITRLALAGYLTGAERGATLEAGMVWMNSQNIRRPECLTGMLFPPASYLP